jgi:hypothetical protein
MGRVGAIRAYDCEHPKISAQEGQRRRHQGGQVPRLRRLAGYPVRHHKAQSHGDRGTDHCTCAEGDLHGRDWPWAPSEESIPTRDQMCIWDSRHGYSQDNNKYMSPVRRLGVHLATRLYSQGGRDIPQLRHVIVSSMSSFTEITTVITVTILGLRLSSFSFSLS